MALRLTTTSVYLTTRIIKNLYSWERRCQIDKLNFNWGEWSHNAATKNYLNIKRIGSFKWYKAFLFRFIVFCAVFFFFSIFSLSLSLFPSSSNSHNIPFAILLRLFSVFMLKFLVRLVFDFLRNWNEKQMKKGNKTTELLNEKKTFETIWLFNLAHVIRSFGFSMPKTVWLTMSAHCTHFKSITEKEGKKNFVLNRRRDK